MACQVKRSRYGDIETVLASNGKESIAYNSLLTAVNSMVDLQELRNRFSGWVGNHIKNVDDPKELALALYKQMYSPAFKEWFGDWETIARAKEKFGETKGLYRMVGARNPEEALFELAQQGLSSESERRGATRAVGEEIMQMAINTFPTTKVGEKFTGKVSKVVDENGEPLIKNVDGEPIFESLNGQMKSIFNLGTFSANNPSIYHQESSPSTTPTPASPATVKKVKEFLNRIGANVHIVEEIRVNGNRLGLNGVADAMRGLIMVMKGKEDIALPEEAMHIAVELIAQKNPVLFKSMMDRIGSYKIFSDVVNDYKDVPGYKTKDGKPDIPKLKREAIAKMLVESVINKNENTTEEPGNLSVVQQWWRAIIDFLKDLFLGAQMDPFEQVAEEVLEGDLGKVEDLKEGDIYFQTSPQDNLYNKISETNNDVSKDGDEFKVNGIVVRNTVEDQVADYYKRRLNNRTIPAITQAAREFKQETESRAKQDIKDILDRYIDDEGVVRETPLEQSNPSMLDPYNNTYYSTLDNYMKDLLTTYGGGTKFMKFINVFDNKTNTVGTIDLLALLPDGKIDILQFKAPDLAVAAKDVAVYKQEAYNIEIEALRRILQNRYGVKRDELRQTRAIPIKVSYEHNIPGEPASGLKVSKIVVGNANVTLIKDDTLLPIPSASETTGNEKLDRLISRLRALADKLSKERVPPEQRSEKSRRVAGLLASIRKLQVQRKAEGIINTAKGIISKQKGMYTILNDAINNTDTQAASIVELNKIAEQIMDEKDQVELYSDLYRVFKDIFTDSSETSQAYLADSRNISDDANDIVDQFWSLSVKFRKEKLAAKLGIKDEFNPEKQLTWYRRMVRSLSQSSIKAGAILWELVKRINSRYELQFQDRLVELKKIDDDVEKWLKGKNVKDLYNKIFQIKEGKWNGKVIQKFSRDFYTRLAQAQEERDLAWVNKNIDVEAYKVWLKGEHQRRIDESKTVRVHEDDEMNRKLIRQNLQDFVDTFYLINKKGVSPNNYKLKDFPKEDQWISDEYKELQKPENAPVFALYNHWIKRLKESYEEGIIDEHNGWSYFPNVRKNLLEKLTLSGGGSKLLSFMGNLRIEAEDSSFGKIDPLTQRPIDEVNALYVSDLGQWVKGADDKYFMDYSEKSMDIFKVLALWDREIIKYKLKTESEALAKLIAYTEEGQGKGRDKGAYKTTRTGKLERDKEGRPVIISNEINARYIKEHIDAVWYGKHMSDESDVSIRIPYKAAAQSLNKLFGRKIVDEPEQEYLEISGVKAISAMNRYFVTKTLGVNVFTSMAQLFGGSVNAYINQGIYMDKKDLAESEYQLISGKMWASDEMKKMAGLLQYFHPYTDDKTREQIRELSLSNWIKHLSSDYLFFMQRAADNNVNSTIAMAFIKNTMVKDGKLVNIREYARKELGYDTKYSGTYEQAKEFDKKLEAKIEELKKSPDALINKTKIVEDKRVEIEGVDRDSDTNIQFRELILKFIKDALGNTSREDLSLYKRSVMWQSFFMFKNWIPRMVDVRLQSLKYVPGSQKYEWGRLRMLGQALLHLKTKSVRALLESLGGGSKSLIEVAKDIYKKKQEEFADQEEEFEMSEAEFIDMFIKGVRSEFKELGLALGLISILFAARLEAPGVDDEVNKNGYKWMLRGIDKLVDEVSFFYTPTSFTDIVNGSVFPAVGVLVDIERFFKAGALKIFWSMLGDDELAANQHPLKYLLKGTPFFKELMTYLAIFDADIAKEYGIRISSQNGSFR